MTTTFSEKLYCVFDKVSGVCSHFVIATSDGMAVRNILLSLSVPLKDTVCLCIGNFSRTMDTNQIVLDWRSCLDFSVCAIREVPWSCYKFPADVAEALLPLDVSPDELKSVISAKQKEILNG